MLVWQCLRRLFEERDAMQGYNGLKYFATIVAVCVRTAYSLDEGMGWRVIAWVSSIVAAVSSTYWDLVIDWGLLQKDSRNRWLRDKLLVPHKSVYIGAMVRRGSIIYDHHHYSSLLYVTSVISCYEYRC